MDILRLQLLLRRGLALTPRQILILIPGPRGQIQWAPTRNLIAHLS
jgi:hypothetical protein